MAVKVYSRATLPGTLSGSKPDHIEEFATWEAALAARDERWDTFQVVLLSANKDGKYVSPSEKEETAAGVHQASREGER